MRKTCDRCGAEVESFLRTLCKKCWHELEDELGYPRTPYVTNADRIRNLSDEDLAEEIWMGCPKGKSISTCGGDLCREPTEEDCVKCWLDWLKQEATE